MDFLLIILEEFGAFGRRIVAGDRGYRYNRRKGIGKRYNRAKGEEMKRDRSTSPTVTVSPERSPSGLRSMRTNTPTMGSPTIRISRASI